MFIVISNNVVEQFVRFEFIRKYQQVLEIQTLLENRLSRLKLISYVHKIKNTRIKSEENKLY